MAVMRGTAEKSSGRRQRSRRLLLLLGLLLFPVLFYYFSPVVVFEGASQGIVTGSAVFFLLLFVSALFFGRIWCSWGCPAGGLQVACSAINSRPARGGKLDWIKWLIWIPWLAGLAFVIYTAGGYRAVDVLFGTYYGISIAEPWRFIIYYIVVALITSPALLAGRRGFCHYVCWMAPFMILGRKLGNLLRLPSLRLQANAARCTDCGTCTRNCPMSLDVHALVHKPKMEHAECILCATCVDGCPAGVIRLGFR